MKELEINEKRNWKGMVFPYDEFIPDDSKECQYCLTDKQAEILRGIIEPLGWKTRWFSDDNSIDQDTIQSFRDDLIRRLMMPCCDDDLIYTYDEDGNLEVSEDGGTVFTPVPEDDIRINPKVKFPPLSGEDGDDKKCIAATGATAILKGQIGDQLTDDMSHYTLQHLITDWTDNIMGNTGPFQALAVIITNQIFALLISAVRAALTDDVYEQFKCILYCHISDSAFFDGAAWEAVRSDILAQITGIAGIFLEHLVYLLGNGGLSNLARSGGASEGDCGDCECEPCLDECDTEWTFYGVHDIEFDGCNTYTMLADGGGAHVAFSSGNSAIGCYCTDGGFNLGSWWPLGSGSPVGGTNPKTTQIWNYDAGDPPAETAYTFIFSSAVIP